MARALAHIEQIHDIRPIAGADRIELVHALGWQLIAKKDEFAEGDLAVYIEIDSKVPENDPRYEFLASKHFKIKTMKMRGALSQGIALPLFMFPEIKDPEVGMDVTELLGIKKIETEEELRLAREEKYDKDRVFKLRIQRVYQYHKKFAKSKFGAWLLKHNFTRKIVAKLLGGKIEKPKAFPSWIKKTDEERIQNLPHYCELPDTFIATEKVDGTSTTFAVRAKNKRCKKYEFIVCSRSVRQVDMKQETYFGDGVDNVYWEMAFKYNIEKILTTIAKGMKAATVVLQGETVGEGLQGNRYDYKGRKFFGYNFIVNGEKWDTIRAADYLKNYGITWVPILDTNFHMLPTVEDMLAYAEGYSVIADDDKHTREGIVFRGLNNPTLSFKAVSNSFLLEKHPDLLARDMAVKKEEEIRGHVMTREEKKDFYKEQGFIVK